MLMVAEEEPRSKHYVPAPGLNLSFESETLDMECIKSLDDAKKKISADLSNKNPQYQVFPFTFSIRPSDNKLWERMGQVVVKATGQWVCFDVPMELDGKARTKRMYVVACMKPTCFIIYVYNSHDGTSSMRAHTCSRVAVIASFGNLHAWVTKKGVPTDHAKAIMTNSLVNMCAYDIRPFAVVEGPGFHDVIQTALDIGFGSNTPLLADDLLQSR